MPNRSGKPQVARVHCNQGSPSLELLEVLAMANLRRWVSIVLCWLAWAGLYGLFLHLEKSLETTLFANGRQAQWWTIVFLYWITDTAIILCFAKTIARPFGFRQPLNFPFFQFASDLAVLVLLLHIAWTCTDKYLVVSLNSVGPAALGWIFLVLGIAWATVAFIKYRQLAGIVRRLSLGSPAPR